MIFEARGPVAISGPGKAASGDARKELKRRIEQELDRFAQFQLAE